MAERWAEMAARQATVQRFDETGESFATVPGIQGAWGLGSSPAESLTDLQSVLVGWVLLKLDDGDDDIPAMEGCELRSRS